MSGRTGMNKGHNIKLVMERNHIKNAVYVGDTESDERAAAYAGIPSSIITSAFLLNYSEFPNSCPIVYSTVTDFARFLG